ncbi:hypothetical protein [Sphingobacterium sp.]|uniref:hypothetical protein n=1 Tax=Sphingobacterium sp. TaxID=341027 RepID=UPI002FDABA10
MTVNQISEQISAGITESFEKEGFKYLKSQRKFVKKTKNVEQVFSMLYTKRNNGSITIKPELLIHIFEIESIYKEIAQIKYRPYLTLGNYFSNIRDYDGDAKKYNGAQTRLWLIENDEDVQHLIKIIPEYLEEDILPYFDKNSSIHRVDELLNEYPRNLSVHNEMYPLRANIAIIAAKLNGNPNYDDLLNIYEQELEDAEENYKIEFYKLKDILENYTT